MIFLMIFFPLVLITLLAYVYLPVKRPFLTESDWTTHKSPWWQLYYSSKYLNPVRLPARNSGLESLFAQNMSPHISVPLQDLKTITIKAVGDLMCRRDLVGEGGRQLWDLIGEYVFSGDLCISNLEFAINPDWVIEKLLRYSAPYSYAQQLLEDKRYGMFHIVSLANNHINDSLSGGIISTCNYLDNIGIRHVGANRTPTEQDKIPIFDCKGVKIAVLSYTFSTNGIPLEKDFQFGVNLIRFNALNDQDYDPALIHHHIKLAKSRGADFIIACNHWGVEFEHYPPLRIVNRAHELLDSGIDLIIGHHPHILNPVERYIAKDGRETFVCYSLGNLTSWGLKFPAQKMSEVAEITLETGITKEGKKSIRVGNVSLMPVFHSMDRGGDVVIHRLFPVIRTLEEIRCGRVPEHMSVYNKWMLKTVGKLHSDCFRQDGVEYL